MKQFSKRIHKKSYLCKQKIRVTFSVGMSSSNDTLTTSGLLYLFTCERTQLDGGAAHETPGAPPSSC